MRRHFSILLVGLLAVLVTMSACGQPDGSQLPEQAQPSPTDEVFLSDEEREAGFTEEDVKDQFGPDSYLPVCDFEGEPNVSGTAYTPMPGADPDDEVGCRASLTGIVRVECAMTPSPKSTVPPCPRPAG